MTGAVTASPLVLPAPQIEWSNLVAIFVLFGGAALSVLLEALVPRRARRTVQIALTILVLIAALVAVIVPWSRGDHLLAGESALALDGPACATWSMLMVFGLGTVLLFAERMGGAQTSFVANASSVPGSALERESEEARREHTEVFPLLLFCLFGMMLFAASNDLILMFVALEIFSLPLYLLTGLSRRRRLVSQEASVKYFLLGALSSAIFLYGIALVYGAAGSFQLGIIAQASMTQISGSKIFAAGMILLAVGLLFKV
ncbi:MAG: proton-conducting transporter membrane subunit, partial [Cutibacterium granulosum]|nr:proton-conducting transporter membrane subunit [Cutibacterium granulosum]